MKQNRPYNFTIETLGDARIPSPIEMSRTQGDRIANYVNEDERILYNVEFQLGDTVRDPGPENSLELAGPREFIYFNPGHVHAGIVTCGGLCPGLNNVIRSIVRTLWYQYGVRRITGIRNGYRGFLPEYNLPVMDLDPEVVDDIHNDGGTILGSSRGGARIEEIVDAMERLNLNMVFTIGGDGTTKGALAISREIEKRGMKIAVIGIPKTIDNDLSFIQRSFGFETAVAKAVEAVSAAHVEAQDTINGIGLVKVMGRESGFIAAYTALAMNDVNFVLIPEIPFELEGPNGFFSYLEKRLRNKNHAVVLVAEGAGQDFFRESQEVDASGNPKLPDIGIYLKSRIGQYFKEKKMECNLKYIDPSYIIRSRPAEATDAVYCLRLGTHAVHAAMSGRTRALISLVNDQYVHVPMELAVSRRNFVDPESSLWRDVVETTRMPLVMRNHDSE